jgi:DNA-binding CsgD family transcriptional regulator/tetratricopeptide (TPR) repeat protein
MLLEREASIETIMARVAVASRGGDGCLVLIGGEAGIGKSSLVEEVASRVRRQHVEVLAGACDALSTPRPLGPLHDIAVATGDRALRELLTGEHRANEVLSKCMELLRERGSCLVVLEDLHWSDAATLDLVRFVARRISSTRAVVVCTYRDEELGSDHPLGSLLGELPPGPALVRMTLAPLSISAVATLTAASQTSIDPDDLYRRTAGNPFFVTEVLASGGDFVPPAIREAVRARAARLSAGARAVLDAAAVVPVVAEVDLLLALCEGRDELVDECQSRGVLLAVEGGLSFRHELARDAIESAIPLARKVSLHRQVLDWLRTQPDSDADVARMVHHAEAAAEADTVLELAPLAATRASALGAHREAAAHLAVAVKTAAGRVPPEILADLLDRQARECSLSDEPRLAGEAQRRALEIWSALGRNRRVGSALKVLAGIAEYEGDGRAARIAAAESIDVLERVAPGAELAAAYLYYSQLLMAADDVDDAIAFAHKALELAETLGADEIALDAQINLGSIEFEHGAEGSRQLLDSAIARARAGGHDEQLVRALLNLGACISRRQFRYAEAREVINEGIEFCDDHGFEAWRLSLLVTLSAIQLATGQLDAAAASSSEVIARSSMWARALALRVLGLVRARRGDPGAWGLLDEAWKLAQTLGEPQHLVPVAVARLEASLLDGKLLEETVAGAESVFELADQRQITFYVGELAVWLARAGRPPEGPIVTCAPWSDELDGNPTLAFGQWTDAGCPYEAAMSLAWSERASDEERREAVRMLRELGANQAAQMVSRRLRQHGTRGVPRGARASTRANPAKLTNRETEVLTLLADGLTNAEIASVLCVSTRTVDHHVGSLLVKLDARNRAVAAVKARRLGVIPPGVGMAQD